MSSQDSVCKKRRLKRDRPSRLLRAASSEMDLTLWGTLPEHIFLCIVTKLSWDDICALSHPRIWKMLWEISLHQPCFEGYAEGRLYKPMCVLYGCLELLSRTRKENRLEHNCKLSYTVLARGGHMESQNLFLSKAKDVATLHHDTVDLAVSTSNSQAAICIRPWGAAGCFVLVNYKKYPFVSNAPGESEAGYGVGSNVTRNVGGDFWIVMNPANATARQIIFPNRNVPVQPDVYENWYCQMSITGIFKDGDSHYQILTTLYDVNEDGHNFYMQNLPKQEDLGIWEFENYDGESDDGDFGDDEFANNSDESEFDETDSDEEDDGRVTNRHFHATFFLYMSRTNSWTKLLGGNLCFDSKFRNPVLYNGVVHALLVSAYIASPRSSDHDSPSNGNIFTIYHVGETSGRTRWVPLAIPIPSKYLLFPHLFVFEGILMLVGGLDGPNQVEDPGPSARILGSVRIWKLDEERVAWVEVACMPDPIFQGRGFEIRCRHLWSMDVVSTNGDYVMLKGGFTMCCTSQASRTRRSREDCVVMYNIPTGRWKFFPGGKDSFSGKNPVTLFERRLEISA